MTTTTTFRKGNPHPLVRLTNRLGGLFSGVDLPWTTLDAEKLIRRARRITKWTDFGSDEFREPLRVMLEAGIEEGQMTYLGRCLVSAAILNALCARLRIQRELHAHPEIREQPIKRPLMIVGAPRTGTTLLNRLLSQDPVSRPLLGWEGIRPAPLRPGQRHGALPRSLVLRMEVNQRILKFASRELFQMHPFGWNQPDEDHLLLLPSFVFPAAMVLPRIHAWLIGQPEHVYARAYADHRLALQILEWQRPATSHWVLKSPLHLWALDAAAGALPEASFIQTHRSLVDVLPSFSSLAGVLMGNLSDAVEPAKMGPAAMQFTRETIDRFTRARLRFDASRILDLPFPELIADPVAAVRKVYATFGYEYTPEFERRMKAYLAGHGKSAPVRHLYTLDQFGLDRDEILDKFADYHQAYGLN